MNAPSGRQALRSAAGWRAFDRASVALALALGLGLLGWLLWAPPSATEPTAEALPAEPARMKLSDQRVALQVLGGKLLLTGPVADEAERQALGSAAEQAFGPGGVDNRLQPRAGTEPLAWRDHAADIFKVLRATGGEPAIVLTGRQVRLEGEVAADYAKLAREVLARQWFGRQTVVDNQLRVAGAASAPAAAAAPAAVAAVAPTQATPTTPAAPAASATPANPLCASLAQGVAVRFHPNAPGLTDEGRRTLRELLPCLAPGTGRWRVGNHTDANGDPDANQRLTQARAESVVAYLAGKGLPAARLQAQGFAATRPVAGQDTPDDRQRNRRVTFEPAP
jgi:outer membrane protein OmpA-like peptidoglycan-associated protein